jgi:serine protease
MPRNPLPYPNASTRLRRARPVAPRALGLLCAALALALVAPVALPSPPAHAAPRAGRPPGGSAIPTTSGARTASPATTATPAAAYVPGVVVVGYGNSNSPAARAAIVHAAGAVDPIPLEGRTRLLTLRPGASVPAAIARLHHTHDVAWAVPDYIAHEATLPQNTSAAASAQATDALAAAAMPAESSTAGAMPTESSTAGAMPAAADALAARTAASEPFPNDPGTAGTPGGWQQLQWNFVGTFGVDAPDAWNNLIADHAPGGRGVIVAVLDTGVAYANRGPFRISPDFYPYQFVAGYDFVGHTRYPNDRNGHGTDVAGTIAEATNNHKGLTGLAYGVHLMPVRVLNSEGNGDASTIAKGVRFAVNHGARVINLSLEFPTGIGAADIPELISALRYADRRRVVVVAAAGNEAHAAAAYPARAPHVIAVGASTEHGCLASYSNYGTGLTLVAPGGGPDAALPGDPNCHPEAPPGQDVFQVTFTGSSPRKFGIPDGYEGTSMATPHVAATAALVIASGVLGRHPTPAQVARRLIATARPLGGPTDRKLYGAGLLDAAAATAPGGPGAVPRKG